MPDDRFGAPRRPHGRGSNGTRPEALSTPRSRFDEVQGDPVDLVAVQADDELINALASGMAVSAPGFGGYDADDQVVALLAAWKAEVDAGPVPELVDLDTAAARVRSAARPQGRRLSLVVPLAAAAAVVVIGAGGLTVGTTAGPDDGIGWEIAKVVDGERVESVLAAERVEERIAVAKDAIARGEPEVAAQALAAAEQDLLSIRPEENAVQLAELQSFLVAKAAETPPGVATPPDAPLASNPARRVPPGAGIDEPVTPRPAPVPATTPVPDPGVTAPEESADAPGPSPAPSDPATPDVSPDPTPTTAEPTPSPTPTVTPEGAPSTPAATEGEPGPATAEEGPAASGSTVEQTPTT